MQIAIGDIVIIIAIAIHVIASLYLIITESLKWIERVFFPARIEAREAIIIAELEQLLAEYERTAFIAS